LSISGYSKGFADAVNDMLPDEKPKIKEAQNTAPSTDGIEDIDSISDEIDSMIDNTLSISKDIEQEVIVTEKKAGAHNMKRVLLKLSGEALAGGKGTGFSEETVKGVAEQVRKISDMGIELGIVIGGGNFWRGRTSNDMDRVKADQIGMLATVMNCIYTADIFRMSGLRCHVMTPFLCGSMTELFDRDKAVSYLENGDIVFFAGGTGHPYFSTDMSTVLMAIEIKAETILAAKAIDGVYSADPKVDPTAVKYDSLSMQEVVEKKLGVIDLAASVLAMENKMPMMLFGLNGEDSIVKALSGKFTGTYITV